MTKLSYEEFKQFCQKSLESILDKEHFDAVLTKISKTDVDVHDSIQFIEKGMKDGMITSFRIKPFYQDYCNGKSLYDVMHGILMTIEEAGSFTYDFDLHNFDQFETTKDTLIVRPICYAHNKKLLENHIYRRVGDIALTLYNVMKEGGGTFSTAKVPKDTALSWNLDVEYLINYAIENTARLYPPYILPIERAFDGYDAIKNTPARNKFFMQPLIKFKLLPSFLNIYFLSIEEGVNGAVAAFYPGVLERVCNILNDDIYLSFTSVREVMIHPVSLFSVNMVKNAAQSNMDNPYMDGENEHLSNNAYKFLRTEKKLKIVH